MKKALLLLLVAFMAIAPMAATASVRTEGMGIQAQQSDDLDLIWLFPQKIDEYSVVDYRLSYLGSDDEWGGIIHKDQYLGSWGLYLGRPFNGSDSFTYGAYPYVDAHAFGITDGLMSWDDQLSMFGASLNTTINDPKNKFDIFKTFKAGNGVLGLHLNYADTRQSEKYTNTQGDANGFTPGETVDGEAHQNNSVIGVDLGYGLSDVGPFNALDLALGYSTGSVDYMTTANVWNAADTASYIPSTETMEGDGISEIRINLRAKKEADENTNMMINLGVKMDKLAVIDTTKNMGGNEVLGDAAGEVYKWASERKGTLIELGVNCDHKVNNGMGRVVAGLTFLTGSTTWTWSQMTSLANSTTADQITNGAGDTEVKLATMVVFGNVGVEANLLKWLQFRAGMSKDLLGSVKFSGTDPNTLVTNAYQNKEETEMTFQSTGDYPVLMTFGLGLNFKNWNVDLLVTKSAIEDLLSAGNLGGGLLYDGSVINPIKAQLKYNL